MSNEEIIEAVNNVKFEIDNFDLEEYLFEAYVNSKDSLLIETVDNIPRLYTQKSTGTDHKFFKDGSRYITSKKHNKTIEIYIKPGFKPCFSDFSNPFENAIYEFDRKIVTTTNLRFRYVIEILSQCRSKKFRFKILNEFQNLITNYPSDEKFMEHLMYYFFKQNIFNLGHSYDFENNCLCNIKKDVEFFEEYLLDYLKDEYFINDKKYRGYMALSTLLSKGSKKALKYLYYLSSIKEQLTLPTENYLENQFIMLIESTELYEITKDLKFGIGYQWQSICEKIVLNNFGNGNNSIVLQALLKNGTKPDIAVGENMQFQGKHIIYSPLIIECKKSVYFGNPDILNNKTTEKYIEFCDELQYWIYEKPDDFEYPNYPKVKYMFLEDICNEYKIDEEIQYEIELLLKVDGILQNISRPLRKFCLDELIERYDYYKNFDISIIHDFSITKKKFKPIKNDVHIETVIRKYDLDGKYITEYSSLQEAADKNNISRVNITEVISGRRNSSKGFIWRECDKKSKVTNIIAPKPIDIAGKEIIQISSEGEIINTYKSIAEASKAVKIDRKGIRDVINKRQKTAGGYFWKAVSVEDSMKKRRDKNECS